MTTVQAGRAAARARKPQTQLQVAQPGVMKQRVFETVPTASLFDDRIPIKLRFKGNRGMLRAFMRFNGAVLILCAPGLWLLPGANVDPALLLYKLGASIFFLFCGTALILRNKAYVQPQVYFDPVRREMRVLHTNARGRPQTVLRRSYDTLGAAKIGARQIEIWDMDGSILLNIPLVDHEARSALRYQLGALVR